MQKCTRKQHVVDILGDFTSGNTVIPTHDGGLHVDFADLTAAARGPLEVRELYHDFLPVDATVDEASVARGLTMFGYVYASLATASCRAIKTRISDQRRRQHQRTPSPSEAVAAPCTREPAVRR